MSSRGSSIKRKTDTFDTNMMLWEGEEKLNFHFVRFKLNKEKWNPLLVEKS